MAIMQSWQSAQQTKQNQTWLSNESCTERRSHATAMLRTQVFVRILEVDVADGGDDGVTVRAPVEAALFQPLEVRRVADLLLDQLLRCLLQRDRQADQLVLLSRGLTKTKQNLVTGAV